VPNTDLDVQQTHHGLGCKNWAVGEVTDNEKHFSSLQYGIIYTDLQMYKRVCAPFNKTSAKLARVTNTKKHLSSFIWARHLDTFFYLHIKGIGVSQRQVLYEPAKVRQTLAVECIYSNYFINRQLLLFIVA
jgi:hypothetical protein